MEGSPLSNQQPTGQRSIAHYACRCIGAPLDEELNMYDYSAVRKVESRRYDVISQAERDLRNAHDIPSDKDIAVVEDCCPRCVDIRGLVVSRPGQLKKDVLAQRRPWHRGWPPRAYRALRGFAAAAASCLPSLGRPRSPPQGRGPLSQPPSPTPSPPPDRSPSQLSTRTPSQPPSLILSETTRSATPEPREEDPTRAIMRATPAQVLYRAGLRRDLDEDDAPDHVSVSAVSALSSWSFVYESSGLDTPWTNVDVWGLEGYQVPPTRSSIQNERPVLRPRAVSDA